MKVLVLGANGMIGSTIFNILCNAKDIDCYGMMRVSSSSLFDEKIFKDMLITYKNLDDIKELFRLINSIKPDIIINCVGITKHLPSSSNHVKVIRINSLFPHQLSNYCSKNSMKLIHISTDCVFSGLKGNYREDDFPDARDLYGKSKHLGEIQSETHLTVRTSTIGHELSTSYGLLEWFLKQKICKGYIRAIFSGVTTVELAIIIRDIILPRPHLTGLYHISSTPINKYSLLKKISHLYQLDINVEACENLKIDRSLNSEKFSKETGYYAPSWEEQLSSMLEHSKENEFNV